MDSYEAGVRKNVEGYPPSACTNVDESDGWWDAYYCPEYLPEDRRETHQEWVNAKITQVLDYRKAHGGFSFDTKVALMCNADASLSDFDAGLLRYATIEEIQSKNIPDMRELFLRLEPLPF